MGQLVRELPPQPRAAPQMSAKKETGAKHAAHAAFATVFWLISVHRQSLKELYP